MAENARETAPVYDRHGVSVIHAPALDALSGMADASIDAVICDPPYGLGNHSPAAVTAALTAWANGDRERVPDGRGFMGQEWDSFVPPPAVWDECLRVLKPGGHLACFAGSRTLDLMTLSVRMAGFEIRDTIAAWVYSSGFPKSLDIAKAIDKQRNDAVEVDHVRGWLDGQRRQAGVTLGEINAHFGHSSSGGGSASSWTSNPTSRSLPTVDQWERLRDLIGFGTEMDAEVLRLNDRKNTVGEAWLARPVVGQYAQPDPRLQSWAEMQGNVRGTAKERRGAAVSDGARQWEGWGTSLAPAFEPIILARRPMTKSVTATVLEHGTGGLNIAATRTAGVPPSVPQGRFGGSNDNRSTAGRNGEMSAPDPGGRWPKNVVLAHHPLCSDESCADGCHVRALDEQTGTLTSGLYRPEHADNRKAAGTYGAMTGRERTASTFGDSGGGSRFFPTFRYEAKAPTSERPQVNGTAHPTVKPLSLVRWLCRLLVPPGGTVLDCFAGSGPTGQAARAEGFTAVLVEKYPLPSKPVHPVDNPDYIALIKARLDARERTPAKSTGDVLGDEPVDLLDLLNEEAS